MEIKEPLQNIREVTLDDLRQMITHSIYHITGDVLPQVRALGVTDLPDFERLKFPNGTASACLESLNQLAAMKEKYMHIIDTNTVVLDEFQWAALGKALHTLGLHPEGNQNA